MPHFAAVIAIVGASTIALTQAQPPAPQTQPPASQAQAPAAKAPAAPSPESVQKAEQVLADVRKALGGDKLEAVKTLVASGRTRRVRGNNLVPIEFEISIELPDKYVRVDEFPAEDTDPTSAGFNGDALIQIPPPPAMPAGRGAVDSGSGRDCSGRAAQWSRGCRTDWSSRNRARSGTSRRSTSGAAPPRGAPPSGAPGAGAAPPGGMMPGGMAPGGRGPAMDPRRARVVTVKQDYARLALGLFARVERLSAHVFLCGDGRGAAGTRRRPRREGRRQLRAALSSSTARRACRSW